MNLDVEQRSTKFDLVLNNDADGFKANLVAIDAVAEALVNAPEAL